MALAIDADGWDLSNEVRRQLLANKSKVMLYLPFKNRLTSCTLLTRWSVSVLKVGVSCGLGSL